MEHASYSFLVVVTAASCLFLAAACRQHFPAGSTVLELEIGDTQVHADAALKILQAHKEEPAVQACLGAVQGRAIVAEMSEPCVSAMQLAR